MVTALEREGRTIAWESRTVATCAFVMTHSTSEMVDVISLGSCLQPSGDKRRK
jgi:hypothetical protein